MAFRRAPVEATQRLVELAAAGGAAVNQICIAHDLGLKVYDLALHLPTADFTEDAALDERGCAATMAFGMEAVAGGVDLLAIGDIGVGGSTAAAAIFAALFGGSGADWVGPGSGADAAMIARKADVVDRGLALHAAHLEGSAGNPAPLRRPRIRGDRRRDPCGAHGEGAGRARRFCGDGRGSDPAARQSGRARSLPAVAGLGRARPPQGDRQAWPAAAARSRPALTARAAGAGLAAGIVKTAALVHSGMAAALPKG